MTIKELVELNFCIAEIEVEVRSNGRLKAKYYIGDGAWRDAKLREHEAHQNYKVEFIAEKINRFENDHVYHDVILKNIPKKILKMPRQYAPHNLLKCPARCSIIIKCIMVNYQLSF